MTFQPDTAPLVAQALFDLGEMVDAYGAIKAEIAALEAKAEAIKNALRATGRDEFREGKLFDATMGITERESVSIKKLRDAGHGDLIAPYISTSDVYTLRCTAKKGK